jgi:hypothetical protein
VTGDGGFAPDGAPISINGSGTPFAMAGVRAAEIPDLAMSHLGLGGVKTRASAARVEYLGGIARRESQIMLRPCGATPDWRIVFFTFRRCMSFHTG